MPTLSVISGAYNLEGCFSFRGSVESVLCQSFTDFEYIICDDGSTDATYNILKEFAERDGRIILLKNESNLGLAATLNRCIGESKGKFIARHDCDDYSLPRRFEIQLSHLNEHPEIALVGSCSYLFDERGIFGISHFPRRVRAEDFLFSSPYQHGSVVFRREILEMVGGYTVSPMTKRTEDYELFMRIQAFAKGENLNEPLYCFLENEDTLKRRKYRYRIDEARVRYRGFKALGLLPRGLPYVIKPLAVGLIPREMLKKLRKSRRERTSFDKRND